jgi:hypothetical protein
MQSIIYILEFERVISDHRQSTWVYISQISRAPVIEGGKRMIVNYCKNSHRCDEAASSREERKV